MRCTLCGEVVQVSGLVRETHRVRRTGEALPHDTVELRAARVPRDSLRRALRWAAGVAALLALAWVGYLLADQVAAWFQELAAGRHSR